VIIFTPGIRRDSPVATVLGNGTDSGTDKHPRVRMLRQPADQPGSPALTGSTGREVIHPDGARIAAIR